MSSLLIGQLQPTIGRAEKWTLTGVSTSRKSAPLAWLGADQVAVFSLHSFWKGMPHEVLSRLSLTRSPPTFLSVPIFLSRPLLGHLTQAGPLALLPLGFPPSRGAGHWLAVVTSPSQHQDHHNTQLPQRTLISVLSTASLPLCRILMRLSGLPTSFLPSHIHHPLPPQERTGVMVQIRPLGLFSPRL